MAVRDETDRIILSGGALFAILPDTPFSIFQDGDTTPSVENNLRFRCANSGVVSITNFDDSSEGQSIKIIGDGFATVVHGTYIKTNTGANKLLGSDKIYTFTYCESLGYWIEDAS